MATRIPISTNCARCGAAHTLHVDAHGYQLWKSGEVLIHDALTSLTESERTLLIDGRCEKCWTACMAEQLTIHTGTQLESEYV